MKKLLIVVFLFVSIFTYGQCPAEIAPYFEDFDNTFPICWTQETSDDFDWSINSGPPPTLQNGFQTGPLDDVTGGGNYIYTEASNPRDLGDEAILFTNSIDISSLTNPELNFYYHMYGDDMGDLDIEIYDGASYANIFTLSGDQGNQWFQVSIPITTSSTIIKFRITGTIGDGWSSDMAIDNFEVREAPTCPAPTSLSFNNLTSTSVEISWQSSVNANSWIINYNGNIINTNSNPTVVNNLTPSTNYSVFVTSICPNNDTSYNSAPITFTTGCPARIAPFTENFDTIFPICWTQEDSLDDFDWTFNNGGTNTANTGPSDDVTGGGNYIYTEASYPRVDGDFAVIYSEDIDISSLTNPELSFYYHMFGSAIGDLNIDLYDGNNYFNIFTLSGDRGDQWFQQSIPITISSNTVKFRITGTLSVGSDGNTLQGDIAIDEFRVFEAIASDLELYKGYSNSGCSLSSNEQVSIVIINKGINPQSNFNVSYKINGGAPISEIVASTLNYGDTLNYIFNTTANLSVDGVYTFEYETQATNDQVPSNNIFIRDEENYFTPAPAIVTNDTVCQGRSLTLQANSNQGIINWYSDSAGLVPLNTNIVNPTTTTTYYAEVQGSEMYKDDFESYNFGDFIAQSSSNWTTISGNGGIQDQEDARISSSQSSSGINSVYLNEINDDNLFLLFNQDINEGIVEINMNLRVETSANINFQNSIIPGSPEIFELRMNSGTLEFDIGAAILTSSYPGNSNWFNLKLEGDLNSSTWNIYIDGVFATGSFIPGANQIGLVNFTTTPGDAYYIDDMEWYVISDDDCYSSLTPIEIFITVPPIFNDIIYDCNSLTWIDGNTYTSSNNTATYTIQNTAGCDSIVTLDLTLNYSTYSTVSNVYCGSYLYNGQTYFSPNIFYDTLTTASGCDSILTIGFEEIVSYGIDTIISCSAYTWIDGNTYTSSNNSASYTVQNAAGCDSIINLNLTINSNQFNPDFTVNQTLFTAPPFAAQFTNTTPNPSNYNFTWDFSDGTILQSNNPSVFHQFLNNGLYDVTLIAENILTGCTDTMFKDDFIFCTGGTSCTHASTINQTGPITACLSDSIFLTCNTDPTFSYQWRLNGTYIPGAIDTIYYPTQSGNYSVLISQNGCPEVSSDISVTVSPTPNPPFITSSGSFVPCQSSFVTLSVPNNFATYSWSSGGTSSTEVITSSGSYFVSVTNSGGCASTSLPFNVNASFVQPPDVCIVGVNPQTNFNRVIWEHPNSTAIDSFYVYKETNQANIYQKIGGTAFNDTAVFDDVSSNPAVQAYRYKLSVVDSCGVESDLGDFHKTIHLTINQGIGSAWNLIWSGYEGFSYPSYNIYRGISSNNMVLLTTIASNLNSYTDLTAPGGQLYYQIEVVSNYTCDPSRSFNSSRSNIVENGQSPSSIINKEINTVKVFPNPTNENITISVSNYNGNIKTEVYDLIGNKLQISNETTINLRDYARGIYLLKVNYGDRVEEIKVIKD